MCEEFNHKSNKARLQYLQMEKDNINSSWWRKHHRNVLQHVPGMRYRQCGYGRNCFTTFFTNRVIQCILYIAQYIFHVKKLIQTADCMIQWCQYYQVFKQTCYDFPLPKCKSDSLPKYLHIFHFCKFPPSNLPLNWSAMALLSIVSEVLVCYWLVKIIPSSITLTSALHCRARICHVATAKMACQQLVEVSFMEVNWIRINVFI